MTRTSTELDVYEAAHLAGGPERVVDTALVALVRTGRVRVHSPGELATADLTRRHPVEGAVLDAVGPSGHRSVDTIRWRAPRDIRLHDVARRLRDDGLVARPGPIGALHRRGVDRPTRAGRALLGQLRAERGNGTDEWRVALGGRAAMADGALRASIFERPRTVEPVPRREARRRMKAEFAADPGLAAARTHLTAFGGGGAIGFADGGGLGDGGGGAGGGDGGGA